MMSSPPIGLNAREDPFVPQGAMRKLVVTENITVDGVIDMAAGWFDPLATDVDQSDIIATNAEHSAAADALLVGRNTFEAFRDFWPKQTDDPTGVSDYLNRVNKYVVSRTIGDPGWQNTTVLRGDLVAEVQALKAAPGRDIVATGSVQLVQALVATGLVDEYRLFVFRLWSDAAHGCSSPGKCRCDCWRRGRSSQVPCCSAIARWQLQRRPRRTRHESGPRNAGVRKRATRPGPLPAGPGAALARIDLEHHVAGEVVLCKVLQHPASLLVASAGREVLVLDRPVPSVRWTCRSRGPQERTRSIAWIGGRGVRESSVRSS